jgi:cysteine synthase A
MRTDNILELIGNTPLLQLKNERVFAKAEFLHPGGSIKDRIALAMLEAARRDDKLRPDSILCEPTSGNTGIGPALVGRLVGISSGANVWAARRLAERIEGHITTVLPDRAE